MHARGGVADAEQRLAGLERRHRAKPPHTVDLGRRQGRKHLVLAGLEHRERRLQPYHRLMRGLIGDLIGNRVRTGFGLRSSLRHLHATPLYFGLGRTGLDCVLD
ncbi:hypothetical protein D3C85_1469940 [compost metagenome]